jgi:hypothetical protein
LYSQLACEISMNATRLVPGQPIYIIITITIIESTFRFSRVSVMHPPPRGISIESLPQTLRPRTSPNVVADLVRTSAHHQSHPPLVPLRLASSHLGSGNGAGSTYSPGHGGGILEGECAV